MAAETFIGAPCRTCGGTERYAYEGRCVACRRAHARKRYADPAVAKAKKQTMRAYYVRNADRLREARLDHYYSLDALAYARHLLKARRRKALARMEARHSGTV